MTHEEKNMEIQKYCRQKPCDFEHCEIKPICDSIAGRFKDNPRECNEAYEIIKGMAILTSDKIKPHDPVNRPAHYTDGKIEVIDFIEDKKLGFCLGNAIKYIARAGKKDPSKEIEDLKKARWYVDRRIKELEEVN